VEQIKHDRLILKKDCYRNPHTSGGQRIERVRHLVLQTLLNTNSQEYALIFNSGTVGPAVPPSHKQP
jgi:hypothetical protein